ncbi:DUF1990 domain-containing protein [Aeromicrobium stalagmiti]|uniref:DUF1990 domain-containing protein n=1 Tax=Aeromicrobium stalagmiti TaxID=2738988 RepID=UPI001568A1FF|nr:DUF1990 domain-containing protein [Aeromicrobium stalagmiti]NRQ50662.1 DUF1990 domain-containing protein [Aeromicrobium stalagmiti]
MTDQPTVPRDGLTYAEVGATEGVLPDGFHHLQESREIGHGRAAFESASATLLTWGMHRRAGVRRTGGPDRAVAGADVAFVWRTVKFECRVVSVVDEAVRRGFTYGTLARHPESGEERFMVTIDPASGTVTASITAFSRPGSVLTRLGGPVARLVQRRMTRRYLDALESAARDGEPR